MTLVTMHATTDQIMALRQLGFDPIPVREEYANVKFESASRAYSYRIPSGMKVTPGDRVTVDKGVYANGQIGTVVSITNTPPPSPYTYNIKAVA